MVECREELRDEARLPGSGPAHDLDDGATSGQHRSVRRVHRFEFVVATQKWHIDVVVIAGVLCMEPVADRECCLGVAFALDEERFERRAFERDVRTVDERFARDDLSRLRFSHEARREIHRVADHGVHTAIGRPDVTGEDVSGVDAGTHLESEGLIQYAAQRTRGCGPLRPRSTPALRP